MTFFTFFSIILCSVSGYQMKAKNFNLSFYYYYLNDQLLKIKLYLFIYFGKQRGFTIKIKTWKKCCDQNMEEML